MPFFGIGLHVVIAIFFAVHVIRSGQQLFWLFILFSFPLLGSIVYFVAIYMPSSNLDRGAKKLVSAAAKSLDPNRELRDARAAFEYTPTAQNQMRLASALLEAGSADEAARVYQQCLSGPFASDLEIRYGAAQAFLAAGRAATALEHLALIRRTNATFRPEKISLLTAQALAASGRNDDAGAEYESALARSNSFEIRTEYAIWAATSGRAELAQRLQQEVRASMQRRDRHTRQLHMPLVRRFDAAFASDGRRA
jgi:hypothetical protein